MSAHKTSADLSRRRFLTQLGAAGLGASALALLPASAAHSESIAQNPALSALDAASIGYKPVPSGIVPTVTLSAPNAPSVLNNPIVYPSVTDHSAGLLNLLFRYQTISPGQAGLTAPYYDFVQSVNVTTTAIGMIMVEFMVDSPLLEILEIGMGGSYRLTIDGVPVTASAIPAAPTDGQYYNRLVDFGGVRSQRLIRLEYDRCFFGGIRCGGNDTLYFPNRPYGPRAIVLGDDYTQGIGGNSQFTGYTAFLGAEMGWDCWPAGVNGGGYLAPDLSGNTFRARVQHDVISYNPEIVIIAGGFNDQLYTATDIGNEASALYSALQSTLPNALLIVIGPWLPFTPVTTALQAVHDALFAAAAATGITFIDVFGWVTGNGNIANPQLFGNSTYYTSADNLHLTQSGHEYLGQRLAGEVMRRNLL